MNFAKLFALFIAVSLFPAIASAKWIQVDPNSRDSERHPYSVEVASTSRGETELTISIHGFNTTPITINGDAYTLINVPGLQLMDERGYPELPRLSRNIALPIGATPEAEVLMSETMSYRVGMIAPSKGAIMRNENPADVPYVFARFYGDNAFYPTETIQLGSPFQLRDITGVTLSFRPFQFNPATGELTIIRRLVVRINTNTPPNTRLLDDLDSVDSAFLKLYRETFVNFEQFDELKETSHLIQDTGRVLVITPTPFLTTLQPWIEWKRQKGLRVYTMTTEETGITPEQIKNTIKRRYQEDKISTVILVGDAEYLAPYPGSAGNAKNKEADPLYGVLEGNDSYPEVMVGRFSVKSTDQLQTIVNKIISYEKNPETDDWYSRTAGIASNEGSPTDWQRAEELRSLLESWHYTSFKKHYDPGVKAADISSSLNNGLGFINYIGHGSKTSWVTSDFSTKDIINLKNGRKMPFIVSVACVNGQFAGSGESFAERWLLAGTPKEPQGAIAIFASSTNQSWVPPHRGPKRNRAPSDFGPHGHNRHSLYPWLYRRP